MDHPNGMADVQNRECTHRMSAPSVLSALLWENKKQQVLQSRAETFFKRKCCVV